MSGHRKVHTYAHNFFFHPQKHTNPSTLMDARQWVRVLLLLMLISFSKFTFIIPIITIIIVMIQHPLPCNKPIRGKLQRATHNSTALKVNVMPEDIFIFLVFRPEKFLYSVIRYKKTYTFPHNFSVSCFLSSGIPQFQYLDGCQAMGKSSSFIEAFCAFRFL